MRRVELLSPAGGYETMVGAFNAGADAVYLGGSKFGARAYADNFDREQVLDAISYAHLHDKKIYMTVNTLVKENEFGELYDFMAPFAEKKLDGVIVQDFGVMRFIRDNFPEIELHASTQQTVTGVYGAKLLKELGCCRVVPARELSLYEMQNIREQADIEVEAFIHGAMCYCYSGACLFSSMVGTRSGNRGRCAQPCRLPYYNDFTGKKEQYPLSLKDMCTIDMIPELLKAGIDSFKIEGRMKKPEYSAGVTALYRKYIDLYYANPDKEFVVSEEDHEILRNLYQRTGISDGYYHKHNGKSMVTISSPAYNGTSEEVLQNVRDKYLGGELKIKCSLDGFFTVGEPAIINMTVEKNGESFVESVSGNVVQKASKRPMDEESITKQLSKMGNTSFEAENITVNIDDNGEGCGIFVAVSELNELRRILCGQMTERLLDNYGANKAAYVNPLYYQETGNRGTEQEAEHEGTSFAVLVNEKAQLEAVLEEISEAVRIYIDSDIYLSLDDKLTKSIREAKESLGVQIFTAFPYVTRKEKWNDLSDLEEIMADKRGINDGVLVRDLEQLGFLKDKDYSGLVALDYSMYVWNAEALKLLRECCTDKGFRVDEVAVPLEITARETKDLTRAIGRNSGIKISYNLYGRAPMMISANCIMKTLKDCSHRQGQIHREKTVLIDRMGNNLPVTTNCRNCYNVIWNAHPTCLYKKMDEIPGLGDFDHYRLDFSVETKEEVKDVIRAFMLHDKGSIDKLNDLSYTTGHYKRGVE